MEPQTLLWLLVVGVGLLGAGFIGLLHGYYARRDGIPVRGRVVGFSQEKVNTTEFYETFPVIEFVDDNGNVVQETMPLSNTSAELGDEMDLIFNRFSTMTLFPAKKSFGIQYWIMIVLGVAAFIYATTQY